MEHDRLPEPHVLVSPVERPSREQSRNLAARLQALEEAICDLHWSTTRDGDFLTDEYSSWQQFTGQSLHQMRGKGWLAVVHPEDRSLLDRVCNDVIATEIHKDLECRLVNKNGKNISLMLRCIPVRDEFGYVYELLFMATFLSLYQQGIDNWPWRRELHIEQQLQEYMQLVQTAAEIGLWSWDIDRDMSVISSPYTTVFPKVESYVPGQPISVEQFLAMIHPDDRQPSMEAIQKSLDQKTDYINQFRIIDPARGTLWMMSYGRAIYDENDRPIRMVGLLINITETKHFEQALQETNAQMTDILESITDAFMAVDENWRLIYVNSQACQYMERPRDEMLGNILWDVYPLLRNTIIEEKYHFVMEKKQPETFDVYWPPFQGWFNIRVFPSQTGLTIYITNITDQKKTEDALRESEAKFRRMVEANVNGVSVVNLQGQVIEANDAYLSMIGVTREELERGEIDWRKMTAPEYAAVDDQALKELRETGMCQPYEKEYILKDGTRRPILISSVVSREKSEHYMSFTVDLTSRKELEKQREHFLGLVSHELRTPLTAINGSLQLAQRRLQRARQSVESLSTLSEEAFGKVDEILIQSLRQTHALNRLIDDLVESARVTADKLTLALQPTDLIDIVRRTVEDMRFTMPDRTIDLRPLPPKALVRIDAGRIGQVLGNLISNALKYSPHEKPVAVGVVLEDHRVRVWVRDWGPGLSPEDQRRIWERYFQGKGVQDRGVKSVNLGLGLHLSRLLVEQHHGCIGVESRLGEGSSFWFELPLLEE